MHNLEQEIENETRETKSNSEAKAQIESGYVPICKQTPEILDEEAEKFWTAIDDKIINGDPETEEDTCAVPLS